MAVPVVASTSIETESTNTQSTAITKPSGTVDNDTVIIVLCLDGDPTGFALPAGFTRISPLDGDKGPSNRCTMELYAKVASSEPSVYNITWSSTQQGMTYAFRITGALTSANFLQDPNNPSSAATDPSTADSFTTDSADTLALAFHTIDRDRITNGQADGGTGWTTEEIRESGGAGGAAGGMSIKGIVSAGVTLNSTQALSTADEWVTRQIGIRSIEPPAAVGFSHGSIIG